MATASLPPDHLLPRQPGGLGPGAALALLAHAGLIAALTVSVDWRSRPTEVVSAELWSAVPQVAAPRPVESPPPAPAPAPAPAPTPAPAPAPPPAPPKIEAAQRDAQIATERAERAKREAAEEKLAEEKRAEDKRAEDRRAERLKAAKLKAEEKRKADAEADKLRQAEAAKKREAEQRTKLAEEKKAAEKKAAEQKAEEQRLAEVREANLKRMQAQVGATGAGSDTATGTEARDSGPSASYVGRLVASIKPNIVFTDRLPGNPAAEVEVRATGTGTILARRLLKSSGHKEWDDAVLRAIDRTGTLPRDTDGRVPSAIVITFRPQE